MGTDDQGLRVGPRQVPGDLLERYQKSGPRYTSYPTAPQFTTDFDRAAVLDRLLAGNHTEPTGLSIYLHIPFCRTRCSYCGCYTLLGYGEDETRRYAKSLLAEVDWWLETCDPSRPVRQLALGGGTPTFLTPDTMRYLCEGLQSKLQFAPDAERSIEVDPRGVDSDYLDLLLELGFNRVSFGVQDLDPRVQKNVNRILPYEKLVGHFDHLAARGLSAINLDLIYGLPGQTVASFERTMERVIALRPSRIATFGYAHVPWVSPHQKELEGLGIPGPALRMELFGLAYDMLADAGWRHVGMDHFSLPEDELVKALDSRTLTRSFMGYTTLRGLDLVACGASAISAASGTYTQNVKAVPEYLRREGGDRWVKGYVLDFEDELRREIIMDLFCNFHLDIRQVEEKFDIRFSDHFAAELEAMKPLVEDGLLVVAEGELAVTDLGRFFIRNISMTFDTYLRREADTSRRYSKTI